MSNLNLNTNINFFAPRIQNHKKSSIRKKLVIILPALLLIALGLVFGYMELRIKDLEKESSELKQYLASPEVAKIKREYNNSKKANDSLKSYESALDTINKNLEAQNIIGSGLIEKINGVLPKDTVFKTYSISGTSVRIAGETASRITSAELLHNLSGTGIFTEVRIGSLAQATPGAVTTFTLEATLKEVSVK